jgi:hypothetical protein
MSLSGRFWTPTIRSRAISVFTCCWPEVCTALPRSSRSEGKLSRGDPWPQAPPAAGIVLAHAVLEPSAVLRAIRASFRENALSISTHFSSGDEVRHRIAPENAGEGFWVSPFPHTMDEFVDFLRSGSGRRVGTVRPCTGRLRRFLRAHRLILVPGAPGRWYPERTTELNQCLL